MTAMNAGAKRCFIIRPLRRESANTVKFWHLVTFWVSRSTSNYKILIRWTTTKKSYWNWMYYWNWKFGTKKFNKKKGDLWLWILNLYFLVQICIQCGRLTKNSLKCRIYPVKNQWSLRWWIFIFLPNTFKMQKVVKDQYNYGKMLGFSYNMCQRISKC